jgi:hypothetical protein
MDEWIDKGRDGRRDGGPEGRRGGFVLDRTCTRGMKTMMTSKY